jgi:hypothetical protein
MKGLIFRELLNMVEDQFGYEMVDKIISDSNLPNDGAYSTVGTYPHSELMTLVSNLSKHSNIKVPQLLEAYGEHAFGIFATNYQAWFEGHTNAYSFLNSVENTIHVEVLKLYPEAELPSITVTEMNDSQMTFVYKSSRKMADFALGLVKGCLKHFNNEAIIEKTAINEDLSKVQFTLKIR